MRAADGPIAVLTTDDSGRRRVGQWSRTCFSSVICLTTRP
jgi:hypothetical protein